MKKIIVIGCPGSGKSVLSRHLHTILGIPLYHLDNLWLTPGGGHIEREVFDSELDAILSTDAWIVDGDYARTREKRIRACDTVVFLDYPLEQCLEGLEERAKQSVRPDCPMVSRTDELTEKAKRFAAEKRPDILELMRRYPCKAWVVLHSRAEAETWLLTLEDAMPDILTTCDKE